MSHIQSSTLAFLKDIKENNNKDWFAKHKAQYEDAKNDVKVFGETLLSAMSEHDEIEKVKLYRIYRDVRFSKDKTPYKNSLAGYFQRATQMRRGGMYFHFEPNNCLIAGGFWNPNSADLARIRQEIAAYPDELRHIISDKNFVSHFGALEGNQLKTAPKGYPRDHHAIDLLRYKQFLLVKKFTDEEVRQKGFLEKVVTTFQAMRPFFDYMSDVLTTNANGESLFE